MNKKSKIAQVERRIDQLYSVCEKITLRTIVFGCFMAEIGRFVAWLLR